MEEGFLLMNLSKHKSWRAIKKEIRLIVCVYTQQKSMERWRTPIHRMITKQQVKNELIKRKQTCSLCFVNVFKFQENNFNIVQKNFQEIKIISIKKRFLGKATGHNDNYSVSMGGKGQRLALIDRCPPVFAALCFQPVAYKNMDS